MVDGYKRVCGYVEMNFCSASWVCFAKRRRGKPTGLHESIVFGVVLGVCAVLVNWIQPESNWIPDPIFWYIYTQISRFTLVAMGC